MRRIAVLGLAALLAAGCAGTVTPAAGAATRTSTVDLPASYRFAPADVTVAAGTTVTWTNSDHFTHSVQFRAPALPADPLVMAPGEDARITFEEPGTYPYVCHLHPQDMKGSVTVEG